MADNLKKFKIVINGVTESIDAVKKLNEQLKETEGIIDRLKNAKVEVKVSAGETTKTTPKVSSGNNSNSEADKLALEIEKEKTKQLQLQNEQLKEQYIQREQLKQANKEALQEIKDQAKGYAEINNGVKAYANTMNGMKSELRDIKAELHDTELGSEKFKELTLRAGQLTERLKEYEQQYGTFGRNVGNYTNSIVDAMGKVRNYLEVDFSKAQVNSLNDLRAMLQKAKEDWANMSPNDANFNKTRDKIKEITAEVKKMEDTLKETGTEAKTTLSQGITVSLDGVEYKFNTVKEAINEMRKRLFELKISGQENTKMFKDLMKNLQDFQREVATANGQISAMAKTSQSISNIISIFKGFGGLAAIGQGFAALFGGADEEVSKMVQKFTALTLALNGVNALQDEITSGQSTFAKQAKAVNEWLDKLFVGFDNFAKKSKESFEFGNILKTFGSLNDYIDDVNERFDKLSYKIKETTGTSSEFQELNNILTEFHGKLNNLDDKGAQRLKDAVDKLKQAFPQLSGEIDKFVEVAKEEDRVQTTLTEDFKRYQELLDKTSPLQKKVANGLARIGITGKVASMAVTGLTIALKTLGKTLLVGFALEALALAMENLGKAIQALISGLKWLYEFFGEFFLGIIRDSTIEQLANELDDLSEKLDSLNKEVDIQIKIGNLGEVEGQLQKLKNNLATFNKSTQTIFTQKEMAEWIKNLKKVSDEVKRGTTNLDDLSGKEKEVAEGLLKISHLDIDLFRELSDKSPVEAMEMVRVELEKIGVSATQLNDIVTYLSQDEEALDDFLDKLDEVDEDLDDIKGGGLKVFGEWLKGLTNFRNELASSVSSIKNDLNSLKNQEYSLRLSLDPKDYETKRKQFEKEWEETAKKYGLTLTEILTMTGRAATEEMRAIAEQLKTNYELAKQINENANKDTSDKDAKDRLKKQRAEENARLELLKEGLDKEIAILEQKRKEELQDAAETGKSRETINAIYDKRILEATKKYEDERTKIIEDNNKRIRDIEAKHKQEMLDMRRSNEDTNTDTAMGSNENQNITVKRNITYDTTTTGNDNVNAQKDYYEKLLAEETRYINEKEQLEAEAAQREHQRQIEDEVARFNSLRESNAQELEERKKALDEMVEQGKITQEEANEMLDKLNEAHMSTEAEQQRQHLENLAAIKKHGEEVITNIHKQAEEERQQATMEALNNMMAATQDFYNDIDKVMERAQKRKTNSAGFIDYGAYRKSIKDALDATKQAAQQIEAEKKRLQDALNNKQISFDDFSKAMKQLNQFAEDVKDKAKELQRTLASSFNTWLGNMMNNINQYTSVLSGMFDTINEMYTRELDAQAEALEKKQEMYDEELEMLEEQLSKQEELTEQHKDKINSTEDELKTARGDRRQALIESLAAEKKAAEESMKQERKLTDEKKKNAQKQEQLKKEQDALDKKRKQAEKRAAIVQATINMFTSISNALAIQPWFLGVALAAVAASLGTANIASIASQQYADGGLLHGPSHKAGGMRIQGTNLEVEGGEMVVNKATTAQNLPLLEYINSNRRRLTKQDLINFYDNGKTSLINKSVQTKFAEGGRLPQLNVNVKDLVKNMTRVQDDRPIVVSVVDIVNATDDLRTVQTLAGVDND